MRSFRRLVSYLRAPTFRRDVAYVAATTVVLSYVNTHVASPMWINGPSMAPLFNLDWDGTGEQDVVLVWLWNPAENLRRGSLVTFWSPMDPERMAFKRVIALEGDEVQTKPPYPKASEVVPKGHVWVEGEHVERRKNMDSNMYGPISKGLLVGKPKAVVWPPSKMCLIGEYYKKTPHVSEGKWAHLLKQDENIPD